MFRMGERIQLTSDFGVLTLATRGDYLKAIGLALSLRVTNPGVPTAVACHPDLFPLLKPYFTHLVEEVKGLKGFAHKVFLDQYTPFKQTLFLDSDVLVFQDLRPHIEMWPHQPYTACGVMKRDGVSLFGLRREPVLKRLSLNEMVCIDGAGHAYFEKPACRPIFERARHVTENYSEYGGGAVYADEDAMNIVMTEMGLKPAPYNSFFSRYASAKKGTLKMDAGQGVCNFVAADSGEKFAPCMMHFAADEAPLAYGYQLHRLYAQFNASGPGLWQMVFGDIYKSQVKPKIRRAVRDHAPWLFEMIKKKKP
jgi:predicted outer membrane repeat protein